ncbi:MAG: response regulator [Deltaproteobacteria bacterium]|nr:response regulator [Deltaproteobacteria bacterium]
MTDTGNQGRVLVVDDDRAILQMVAKMVEVLGFEVKSTIDGGDALRMLREQPFDLVISDLMMPGIGGRELMETVHALQIDVSVLFISAAGTIAEVVDLMKLGAVGFVEKPFTASGLRKEVLEAFRARRTRARPKSDTEASVPPVLAGAVHATPASPSVDPKDASFVIDVDHSAAAPSPAAHTPPSGGHSALQIGRYQLRILLGMGGMGSVYRAFDTVLGREVALKVIRVPPDPDRRTEAVQRFTSEARAAAGLAHPGIVGVFDFGEDTARGVHYLVMELVRGVSLRETIRGLGPLSVARTLSIAYQLADALAFAHRRGVVHRDVKPENVLLVGDRAKLVDFGIAKIEGVQITQEARMVGSPSYLSPEGARGEKVDGRADQFSLATVILEMLTGKRVFEAESIVATARRVCDLPPPTLASLGVTVPDRFQQLVRKMHAKDARDRYQDETALLEDLSSIAKEFGLNLTPAEEAT